jgi:mannan endo-1,4-beta-mannosidase
LFVLGGGSSRIEIGKGWGYYDIDYVELRAATPDPVHKPPKTLADGDATPEARSLHGYLVDQFGEKTLVGQQDLSEIEYVRSATGKEPAIGAFDLMEYSPSRRAHGADPKGLVEKIIAWADRPGIVSLSWHWNAPRDLLDEPGKEWWRGFNTNATNFDVAAALAAPDSDAYRALIGDIDAIAVELGKLAAAHIPVLWRPLHEAQGGWFWWGAKGQEPFVALYRLLFDRLVHHHGLHNLVWVYSPPDSGTEALEWYPGDDCVDVIGADVYTDATSSISGPWRSLLRTYSGRKLVALGETGTLPDPALERRVGIRWSYTTLWSGQFLRGMPLDRLRAVYSDPDVVTRDELPDLRHSRTPGS